MNVRSLLLGAGLVLAFCAVPVGRGAQVLVSGELKQWHKVTVTIEGPEAAETGSNPNPFTDYRFTVRFAHASGSPVYEVPGYFAADGDAANSSATRGNRWRAHLSPDKTGEWSYRISFVRGPGVAISEGAGEPVSGCDGLAGRFTIKPTDKSGRDFRAGGRLEYVGRRYLQAAGSREFFLKAGADAPENLLAYADFDGTYSAKKVGAQRSGEAAVSALKTWGPHLRDWRPGDPTWKGERGKGLIGALNYLAGKGCTAFSFLTYNAGGDGDDVWPFVVRDDKLHYDCSKLDQWQIVFDHATALGLYCHFKTQETENDDLKGPGAAQSLDGGDLGPERKLYYRELIARFGHLLALNWNLGEENSQSAAQQRACARYFHEHDPYQHLVVVHTFPDQQDQVYGQLLGRQSELTGASLQNSWRAAHQRVLKWVTESAKAGKPWVVANDEQNPASLGVPPDPGYGGFSGVAREKESDPGYTIDDLRKYTLWGTLLAGGQGVEYYFGYTLPQNDLNCEDYRSRDRSWDYCRIALAFFREQRIPFWDMNNADQLAGNATGDNTRFCFAKPGEIYLVYLPQGLSVSGAGGQAEAARLDLSNAEGEFTVRWFDPRHGGALQEGTVRTVKAGMPGAVLGQPPADPEQDWLVVVRQTK